MRNTNIFTKTLVYVFAVTWSPLFDSFVNKEIVYYSEIGRTPLARGILSPFSLFSMISDNGGLID